MKLSIPNLYYASRDCLPSWEGLRGGLTVGASDRNPTPPFRHPSQEGMKWEILMNPGVADPRYGFL